MNPIAWLRRLFSSPPPPVAEEPPAEPVLTLAEARRRFREALAAWDAGEASTGATHEEMTVLSQTIFRQCMAGVATRSQQAYDFFNLAGELSSATSYEPKSRWIAKVGLQLEAEALGHLHSHPAWGEIVGARGPIEHFLLKKCTKCELEFPDIGTSGFLMMTFLWCADCGSIYGATAASDEGLIPLRPYAAWLPEEQARIARDLGVPWRRCRCGGTVHDTVGDSGNCPRCRSTPHCHERVPISSFQYFEEHKFGSLESLLVLPPPEGEESPHDAGSGI